MRKFTHVFFNIIKRIFTRDNLCKLFIIFVFGFVSRFLINSYFDINVFIEFLNPISVLYYMFFSSFIVIIHEFVNFSSLPSLSFLFNRLNGFIINNFSTLKQNYNDLNFSDFKESFKSIYKRLITRDKLYLGDIDSNKLGKIDEVLCDPDNNIARKKDENDNINGDLFKKSGSSESKSGGSKSSGSKSGDSKSSGSKSSSSKYGGSSSKVVDSKSGDYSYIYDDYMEDNSSNTKNKGKQVRRVSGSDNLKGSVESSPTEQWFKYNTAERPRNSLRTSYNSQNNGYNIRNSKGEYIDVFYNGFSQSEVNYVNDRISNFNYDMTKAPRMSNLSTPSNLSGDVPFGTNNAYTKAPRMSNISTPSDLSGQIPFSNNTTNYPRTPILTNLSTPSNLSGIDQSLLPRPLNPISRNSEFGSADSKRLVTSKNYYPVPYRESFNPNDNLYGVTYSPINTVSNTEFNSRLSTDIGEYSNVNNSRYTYPIGEIPRTPVTSSPNYQLPAQVPYPPTDYNYEYIYSPTAASTNTANNTAPNTNSNTVPYYDYIYTPANTQAAPNYHYYRSRVVNAINENNDTTKEVVSLHLPRENEIQLISGNGKFTLVFRLFDYDLDKIEKVLIKYHDLSKRKLMWNLWEKGRNKYGSYAEFKSEFNPKSSIFRTIFKETKSDLSSEIRALINSNNPFGRSRIEYPNPKSIGFTSTQRNLNTLNANRYGAQDLDRSAIKHKHIKRSRH